MARHGMAWQRRQGGAGRGTAGPGMATQARHGAARLGKARQGAVTHGKVGQGTKARKCNNLWAFFIDFLSMMC